MSGPIYPRRGCRDALYELEMYRALLAEAERQGEEALLPGLRAEIAFWAGEVERELVPGGGACY